MDRQTQPWQLSFGFFWLSPQHSTSPSSSGILGYLSSSILSKNSKVTLSPDVNPLFFTALVFYVLFLTAPLLITIIHLIVLSSEGVNPAAPWFFAQLFLCAYVATPPDFLTFPKILLAFSALTVSQFLSAMLSADFKELGNAFFSLSSIFLTLNGILFCILLYLRDNKFWAPEVALTSFPQIGQLISQQIKNDSKYKGGPLRYFSMLEGLPKTVAMAALYLASLGILAAYSWVLLAKTQLLHLGTINSVAVVTTDVILLLLVNRKEKRNVMAEGVLSFLARILLVVFGVQYWFVGYCIAYILFGTYISMQIINKYHAKANQTPVVRPVSRDIVKTSQFIMLFFNAVFWAVVFYLGYGRSPSIPVTIIDIVGKKLQFWVLGVISSVALFCIFCLLASLRVYQLNQYKFLQLKKYYIFHQALNLYYVYSLLFYAGILILTVSLGVVSTPRDNLLILSGIFIPVFFFLISVFYTNWYKNGYLILGDIVKMNQQIQVNLERQKKEKSMRQEYRKRLSQDFQKEIGTKALRPQGFSELKMLREGDYIQQFNAKESLAFEETFVEEIQDWRNQGFIKAFFLKKLLRTDYYNIFSLLLLTILLPVYGGVVFYTGIQFVSKFVGWAVALQIFVGVIVLPPIQRHYLTLQELGLTDILTITFGWALHFGLGLLYYGVMVGTYSQMDGYLVFLLFLPAPYFFSYGLIKYRDDKFSGFSKFSLSFMVLGIVFGVVAGIILAVKISIGGGLALIGLVIGIALAVQTYALKKTVKQIPTTWLIILGVICSGVIIGIIIAAFVNNSGNGLWTFIIAFMILTVGVTLVGGYLFLRVQWMNEAFSIYYSPYLFNNFSYNLTSARLMNFNIPLRLVFLGVGMLFVCALVIALFYKPIHLGISLSVIPEIIAFLLIFSLSSRTARQIKSIMKSKSSNNDMYQIFKRAWKKTSNVFAGSTKRKQQWVQQLAVSTDQQERQNIQSQIEQRDYVQHQICSHFVLEILLQLQSLQQLEMEEMLNFVDEARFELQKYSINVQTAKDVSSIRMKYAQLQQDIESLPSDQKYYFYALKSKFKEIKKKREIQQEQLKKLQEQAGKRRQKQLEERMKLQLQKQRQQEQINKLNLLKQQERKQLEQEQFKKNQAEKIRIIEQQRRAAEEAKKLQAERKAKEQEAKKQELQRQKIQQQRKSLQEQMKRQQQKRKEEEKKRQQEQLNLVIMKGMQQQKKKAEQQLRKKQEEQKRRAEQARVKLQELKRQEQLQRQLREQQEKKRLELEAAAKKKQQQRLRLEEQLRRKQQEKKMLEQRNKQAQNQRKNTSIVQPTETIEQVMRMPTGISKVQALRKFFPPAGSQLFLDKQLAKESYIDQQLAQNMKGWKRPDFAKSCLYKQSQDSSMKVHQGYIGDCYLISAMGVLGIHLAKVIGLNQWQNPKGGYLVRFSRLGDPIYVLIDDQFPVYQRDWAFGHCEDQNQLWVNVIQKAFAKLNGGYKNIVGGRIYEALSQITGGIPSYITTANFKTNDSALFSKIKQLLNQGALLGASSNPSKNGDRDTSGRGVVQGHAYLIMKTAQVQGTKLVKMRNPHGNNGQEWTGDWSDTSPLWTSRTLSLIGESKSDFGKDGAFWINTTDLIKEFRQISVCRLFDSQKWKIFPTISGEWKGASAVGLTGGNYLANPQFGITVNKECNIVVVLDQAAADDEDMKYIFMMVQNNDGKRIKGNYTSKIVLSTGAATNVKTISMQGKLSPPRLPFTYSVMASTYNPKEQTQFLIKFYCDDLSAQLVPNDKLMA